MALHDLLPALSGLALLSLGVLGWRELECFSDGSLDNSDDDVGRQGDNTKTARDVSE